MRCGNFELVVVKSDGTPFPEVCDGEHTYVVATPGQAYEMHVMWLGGGNPLPMNHQYRVDLKVDGTYLGASYMIDEPDMVQVVPGFLKRADESGASYHSTVFAEPVASGHAVDSDVTSTGKITGSVYLCRGEERSKQVANNGVNFGGTAKVSVQDDKKVRHCTRPGCTGRR